MIAYLIKNWKLFLDIIIVVGGIIAFTLFDPFGVFTNTKLRGTANLVSSVRNIGELVTAEYYGEVIASLHETRIYDLEPDTLYEKFENCYYSLKNIVVSEMMDSDEKHFLFFKQKVSSEIENSAALASLKSDYKENEIYNHLITFLAVNNLNGNSEDYYNINKGLKPNAQNEVIRLLINDLRDYMKNEQTSKNDLTISDMQDFIFSTPAYFDEVSDFHYSLNKEQQTSRKVRKKDIVFIGRGWVKAGFRFGQLDESNFYYDKDLKIIRFYGLEPCILDKDINPWFIPERKVKGFELVDFYKNATFEEAKEVKKKCKEKLLAQAEKADILTRSKENGEEALKNFFSLLLDEPELSVEMVEFPFEKDFQMISADTLITVEEALHIDSLYRQVLQDTLNITASEIARQQRIFNMFLRRLEKLSFVDKGVHFSLPSLEAAKVLEHTAFITKKDYHFMDSIRSPLFFNNEGELTSAYIEKNKAFLNYTSFTTHFNEMMKLIDNKLSEVDSLRSDSLFISPARYKSLGLSETEAPKTAKTMGINKDTIYQILLKKADYKFSDLSYPIVKLRTDKLEELTSLQDTVKINDHFEDYIYNPHIKFENPDRSKIFQEDLNKIEKYKADSIKRSIKVGPIRAFTKRINNLLK